MEPLQGWHLPLLDDPAFLTLQPLLQRAVLLAVPERLLSALTPGRSPGPQVLVASRTDTAGRTHPLGLLVSRQLNRSGTCWQVEHLRLALGAMEVPGSPTRQTVASALLREALQRARGAASWIATASTLDAFRLAILREQGFQPQRTDRIWRWQPAPSSPLPAPPTDLQLRPLNRRTAALLWHLEQAVCPAQLRQLLDRRVEDLLAQSDGRGWMLVDGSRNEAVVAARQLPEPAGEGMGVELSIHPGWEQLLGSPAELVLRRLTADCGTVWLRSEVGDDPRAGWLEDLGAEARGEQVLMARSVWRRQERQPASAAARRLGAVLEQLQPRRRPLPTPVGPR